MKPVPTYVLLQWERLLQPNPLPAFEFPAGDFTGQGTITGEQQPKYAFVALPLSYGYLSDRQDSNLQPAN